LFWIDDERSIEVENHILEPFGRERFLDIMDWTRKYQEPGWKMKFYDTTGLSACPPFFLYIS